MPFTQLEIDYVTKYHEQYSDVQIAQHLNVKRLRIKSLRHKLKLFVTPERHRAIVTDRLRKTKERLWTDADSALLREHYDSMTIVELVALWGGAFRRKTIQNYASRLGLKKSKEGIVKARKYQWQVMRASGYVPASHSLPDHYIVRMCLRVSKENTQTVIREHRNLIDYNRQRLLKARSKA